MCVIYVSVLYRGWSAVKIFRYASKVSITVMNTSADWVAYYIQQVSIHSPKRHTDTYCTSVIHWNFIVYCFICRTRVYRFLLFFMESKQLNYVKRKTDRRLSRLFATRNMSHLMRKYSIFLL